MPRFGILAASHTGRENDKTPALLGVSVSLMRLSSPGLRFPSVGLTYRAGVTGPVEAIGFGGTGQAEAPAPTSPSVIGSASLKSASSMTQLSPLDGCRNQLTIG